MRNLQQENIKIVKKISKTLPLKGKKRIEVIDALRGFAILGILLANIMSFSGFKFLPIDEIKQLPSFGIDLFIYKLNAIFVDTKFYTIFSLLFGIGFYFQFNKNRENQHDFMKVYYRRLFFLMMFGLIHMFFWSGDILFIYAITAVIFVQFRNLDAKKMLIVSAISFIAPLFIDVVMLFVNPGYMVPPVKLALKTYVDLSPSDIKNTFETGSFYDMLHLNFHNLKWRWFDLLPSGRFFKVFSFFMLGFYLMSSNYFLTKAFSKKLLAVYLVVGLCLTLVSKLVVGGSMGQFPSDWNDMLYKLLFSLGQVNLAFAYISILTMAYDTVLGKRLMVGLKYVGRMSFSSYLSHTIIGIIIFYPYALGLFNEFSLWQIELMAVGIYVLQVLFAKIWLKYFDFGPLEWLWRCLTYGKLLPFKKNNN